MKPSCNLLHGPWGEGGYGGLPYWFWPRAWFLLFGVRLSNTPPLPGSRSIDTPTPHGSAVGGRRQPTQDQPPRVRSLPPESAVKASQFRPGTQPLPTSDRVQRRTVYGAQKKGRPGVTQDGPNGATSCG